MNDPLISAASHSVLKPVDTSVADTLAAVQAAGASQKVYYPAFRHVFFQLKHDKNDLSSDTDFELPKNCFLAYNKCELTGDTLYDSIHPTFLQHKIVAFRGVPLYADYGLRLAGGENGPVCSTIGARIGDTVWNNPYPFSSFIYYPVNKNDDSAPEPVPQLKVGSFESLGSRNETCYECVLKGNNVTTTAKNETYKCSGRGRLLLAVFDVGILQNVQNKGSDGLVTVGQSITWMSADRIGFTYPFVVLMDAPAGSLYDSKVRPLSSTIRQTSYLPSMLMTFKGLTTALAKLGGTVQKVTPKSFPNHPEVYVHNAVVEFYAAPLQATPTNVLAAHHRYMPTFCFTHPSHLAVPVEQYVSTAWAYYVFALDAHAAFKETGVRNEEWLCTPANGQTPKKDIDNLVAKLKGTK